MVKRKEVEALLKRAEFVQMGVIRVWAADVAELARAWLAVDEAEVGEVVHLCTFDAGAECHVYRSERFPSELDGQRVRLVPEADSGGDRG